VCGALRGSAPARVAYQVQGIAGANLAVAIVGLDSKRVLFSQGELATLELYSVALRAIPARLQESRVFRRLAVDPLLDCYFGEHETSGWLGLRGEGSPVKQMPPLNWRH